MRRLRRQQQRVDRIGQDVRRRSGGIGKWVYLLALLGLVAWLLNQFLGELVFFTAQGFVVREENRVSVPYPARVVSVDVEVGDAVGAGEPVARVESLTIRETIAQISLAIADLERERSELQARAVEIDALLPIARRRAARMAALLDQNTDAYERGLTTSVNRSVLIEDEFDAAEKVAELRAERGETDRQIGLIDQQQAELMARRALFEKSYGDGIVRAPVAGNVFDVTATVGGVVRAADPILTMVGGEPHILAYVNPGSLAELPVGSSVRIEYGVREIEGRITRIFPLSKQLPAEFQRQFRPQERSQLIRIDFAEGAAPPPTFTTVEISSADPWPSWAKRLFGEETETRTATSDNGAKPANGADAAANGGTQRTAAGRATGADTPDAGPQPASAPRRVRLDSSDILVDSPPPATVDELLARETMLAETVPNASAKPLPEDVLVRAWRVQTGAFESRARAEIASRRLNAAYGPFEELDVRILEDAGPDTAAARFRVQLGPFESQAAAVERCERFEAAGQPCIPVSPVGR